MEGKMIITKLEFKQWLNKKNVLMKQLEDLDRETAARKALLEGRLIEINEVIFNAKVEEEK
jgi:hypothetical protein